MEYLVDVLNDVNVFEKAAYPQSVWITGGPSALQSNPFLAPELLT